MVAIREMSTTGPCGTVNFQEPASYPQESDDPWRLSCPNERQILPMFREMLTQRFGLQIVEERVEEED